MKHCSGCRYPVYKDGGVEGMLWAIGKNVRFPEHLQKDGKVFVQFTINEQGQVRNAVVKQGFRPDADSAAVRAVRLLGEFTPALDAQGRPIAVRQTVPVTFSLQ
ncbi:TonB family protein [Hymenobacter metallilatus]|uniref:TonB family protein n=1 Tax=Hymenobacter metallilatus TaxID=2493666 RepID=UPI00163ACFBF|nr:TonB family protein [Hymenobacter metallilatus]